MQLWAVVKVYSQLTVQLWALVKVYSQLTVKRPPLVYMKDLELDPGVQSLPVCTLVVGLQQAIQAMLLSKKGWLEETDSL